MAIQPQISCKGDLHSAASGSSNSTSLRLTSLTALAEKISETLEFQKKVVFLTMEKLYLMPFFQKHC
jgi:hypothetical protein